MSDVIVERGADKVVSIFREPTLHRSFTVPASWETLRIALRMTLNGSSAATGNDNYFKIGLASADGANFIAYQSGSTGYSYYAESGADAAAYYSYIYSYSVTPIGLGSNNSTKTRHWLPAVPTLHRAVFLDFIKGSPNWTVRVFAPSIRPTLAFDVTHDIFTDCMMDAVPSLKEHTQWSLTPVAFNEVGGAMSMVTMLWTTSAVDIYCEISDFYILKLS